jgi:hypothetical protein
LDTKQIDQFYRENQYIELQDYLNECFKNTSDLNEQSEINYQLGLLFSNFRFERHNKKRAASYFKMSLRNNKENYLCYIGVANTEQDVNTKINYLLEGHKIHLKNINIIYELSKLYENDDLELKKKVFEANIQNSADVFMGLKTLMQYDFFEEMLAFMQKRASNINFYEYEILFLYLLRLYLSIRVNKIGKDEIDLAERLIKRDKDNNLQYIPYLYKAYMYFLIGNKESAYETLIRIPFSHSVMLEFDGPFFPMELNVEDDINIFLSTMAENYSSEEVKFNFIKTLSSIMKYNYGLMVEIKYETDDLDNLIRFNELNEVNDYVSCAIVNYHLEMKLYLKSIEYYIKYLKAGVKFESGDVFISTAFENLTSSELGKVNTLISSEVDLYLKGEEWVHANMEMLIDPFIEVLFKSEREDKHKLVSEYAIVMLEERMYKNMESVFEMAYSLSNQSYKKKSKIMYEFLLEKGNRSSAVLNNLAVILNENGNYREAEALYKEANELDPDDQITSRNFKTTLKENNRRRAAVEKVGSLLVNDFSSLVNVSENIKGPFSVNSLYFENAGISEYLNQQQFHHLVNKNFIEEIDLNGINKYQANLFLSDKIKDYQNYRMLNECEFISMNYTIFDIEQVGIDNQFLGKIFSITDKELKPIISQDLFECIIAMQSDMLKASMVLIGSFFEGFITYILKLRGYDKILTSKGKTISLANAKLNEMIEFAKSKSIIKGRKYYFAHILRDYRNLIHPGKITKEKFELSKDDVKVAWTSVVQLVKTSL